MKKYIILSFILLMIFPGFAVENEEFIEIKSRYGFPVKRPHPVNFNIYLDREDVNSNPVIWATVNIQNDVLQFEKQDNAYQAQYRVSIAVRDDSTSIIQFTQKHDIILKDFERTNSVREHQVQFYKLNNGNEGHDFHKGKYTCYAEIEDLVTKKTVRRQKDFFIGDNYNQRWANSIAFLVAHPDSSENLLKIAAQNEYLYYNKPYYAFTRLHTDSVKAAFASIYLYKEDKVLDTLTIEINPDLNLQTLVYPLPYNSLNEGNYKVEIVAGDKKIQRPFKIFWFQKPTYLYEVDLAIRPLQYLLSEEEIEYTDDLSKKELQKWFDSFWKQRDPTPNTKFNELLNEYYQRVFESNRKYRVKNREGWETDRGRIFILYGPPQSIENGRYATHSLPYLIWKYSDSLTFLFVDKKRNGNFELQDLEQKE